MSARLKLNSAAIQGALIIGGLIGWAFGSWLAFFITAVTILATALHSRDIRTTASPTHARGPKIRTMHRRRR